MGKITSVSISDEFYEMLEDYKFSPTDIFRRGLSVMLYDLEIAQYQTDKNKKRKYGVIDLEILRHQIKIKELEKEIKFRLERIEKLKGGNQNVQKSKKNNN